MPVLFMGHGSPMNAIEDNRFSLTWGEMSKLIPKPKVILSVSAHWYTDGTRIQNVMNPKMIYDMYGFPAELYEVVYPAKGSPDTADKTRGLIGRDVIIDNSWGLDHGTWSVLRRMYPEADIPVFQLSIDKNLSAAEHYKIGSEIKELRKEGVLIFGSGNVVHNLALIGWNMNGGYAWAEEFDIYIKENISKKDFDAVINYKKAGESSRNAFFTPEHFDPLLYVLGAANEDDVVAVYNDSCTMGSLSMTSYLIGEKTH
jgi:4,5-DOPA dioxygenase extradiol